MKKERQTDPFSWDSISINKYYEIYDILFEEDPEKEHELSKQVRLVSVVTDIPEDEIWSMPLTESTSLIQKLTFLNNLNIDNHTFKTITINNQKYDVMTDASAMTTSQFIDYQMFTKLPFRDAIDKLLSIFVIPRGHRYNENYDIVAVQRDFREFMPFKTAQELLGFILARYVRLLNSTLAYLAKKIKRMKNPPQEILNKIELTKRELINLRSFLGCVS